ALAAGDDKQRQLGGDQQRRQQRQGRPPEVREDRHQAMALEEEPLLVVEPPAVVVADERARYVPDLRTGEPGPPAEVRILIEEEELVAVPIEPFVQLAADQHRSTGRDEDGPLG